jgi:putative peptidoglycan lipid II flippase
MSRAMALGDSAQYARLIVRALRLLLYVMLFLTAMTVVLREQVVTLLFEYGNFSASAVELTAQTLLFFALGLAGHAMIVILARAFYADKDTRTPVAAAILSVVVNVTVSVALIGSLGLAGLALGIAAGAWFEATLLATLLWRRAPALRGSGIVRAGVLFAVGAVLAGGVAAAVTYGMGLVLGPAVADAKLLVLLQAAFAFGAAGLAYLAYSQLLGLPEFRETLAIAVSALRRERPAA